MLIVSITASRAPAADRRSPPRPAPTATARRHPASVISTATDAPTTAATASANAERVAAGGTGSTPTPTSNTVKHHPHHLGAVGEPAQPAAHRLDRPPHHRGHPPSPRASRPRGQRRPDHPTASARLNSANTGSRTCDTPHSPHRARRGRTTTEPADTPQDPRPGPAPRPQRPTTTRTHQLTPDKPVLDPASVHPYREHSASARDTALPDALGQETPGGPFVCPHRHGAAAHQHHTRPGTHQDPSAPTMPGNLPTRRHPQCRSTISAALGSSRVGTGLSS